MVVVEQDLKIYLAGSWSGLRTAKGERAEPHGTCSTPEKPRPLAMATWASGQHQPSRQGVHHQPRGTLTSWSTPGHLSTLETRGEQQSGCSTQRERKHLVEP